MPPYPEDECAHHSPLFDIPHTLSRYTDPGNCYIGRRLVLVPFVFVHTYITSGHAQSVFKRKGKYAVLKDLRAPRELKGDTMLFRNL